MRTGANLRAYMAVRSVFLETAGKRKGAFNLVQVVGRKNTDTLFEADSRQGSDRLDVRN